MHPFQERDGEVDRKPSGKTRVSNKHGKCGCHEVGQYVLDGTKWNNAIQNHSGDPI